jgi:isopentenyl diphosphate isomerase/L-lactate dehydrogenase-like FMN-dependent dehydrogenase
MDRRLFNQLMALGAGALGVTTDGEELQAAEEAPVAGRATPFRGREQEPVNIAEVRSLAQRKMATATFEYVDTGSMDELTLRENIDAFQRIQLIPRLLHGVSNVDLSTTVLGQKIAMPIMLAPVAGQAMYHPNGGMAAARAAADAGTVYCMSSSVGNSVEEIASASKGPKWFQLYVPKDRGVTRQLVQRAEKAGFKALIMTVDLGEWKDADRRNKFALPKDMLVKHLRDTGFDQITDAMSYQEVLDFNSEAWDLSLDWKFFEWLRKVTDMPLIIKGVLRKDDAQMAIAVGVDGIVVSNHGGRRLDGMPATIDMLPGVVDVVRGSAEVYLDGGIRRGTDVLKAMARGARAVLIGRPYAWGLGAAGEAGVSVVLELLREEFENSMTSSGFAGVADIDKSLLL